jgi:hypothetical protein
VLRVDMTRSPTNDLRTFGSQRRKRNREITDKCEVEVLAPVWSLILSIQYLQNFDSQSLFRTCFEYRDHILGAVCPHIDKKTTHRIALGVSVHEHDVFFQRKDVAEACRGTVVFFTSPQRVVRAVN